MTSHLHRRHWFESFSTLTVGLLICRPALAHGEEVLLLPIGQLLAIPALIFIIRRYAKSRWVTALVATSAVATGAALWFVPGSFFPSWLRHTGTGNFLLGVLPPLVIAYVVASINRLFGQGRPHDA